MKISTAIFRQKALGDQQRRICSKKPVLSRSMHHPEPFDKLTMYLSKYHPEPVEGWFDGLTMIVVLLTSHFSLLTGLENAAGGFFQQTLICSLKSE